MTEYKCEEASSSCTKFQSAICLHCNRRLCVVHITEHNQTTCHDDLDKLSDLIQVILQQIKDKSQRSRTMYDSLLPAFDRSRKQQLEKVQQIYEHELERVDLREKTLMTFHRYLLEQLEHGARQPLERLQKQQHINSGILAHIQQITKQVERSSVHLRWHLATPLALDSNLQLPSILTHVQLSLNGNNNSIEKESSEAVSPSHSAAKQLIEQFSDTSSILTSKFNIELFVKKNQLKLLAIVNAYLTACHQKSSADEKLQLLNGHMSTIKRYLKKDEDALGILIGIQTFFANNIFEDNEKSGIMSFLLQFFLGHQCINQTMILKWYSSEQARQYQGFDEAKQLAKSYISTFSTID